MRICESLYQKGYVSYPRTETAFFSEGTDFHGLLGIQTHSGVWGEYAQKLMGGRFVSPRKGKGDDHAHPPIHPTKLLELGTAQSICMSERSKNSVEWNSYCLWIIHLFFVSLSAH